MNFWYYFKLLWLSNSTVNIGKVVKKVGFLNKRCGTRSDHIIDFTRSGYKIIPIMWSELAEVRG